MIIDHVSKKSIKNYYGDTPLHFAACYGYLEICEVFIINMKHSNPKNEFGETPLDQALKNNHSSVVEFFQAIKNTQKRKSDKKERILKRIKSK